MTDFTKRAALDKGNGTSKLIMLCGKEYRYRLLYLSKSTPSARELAYYYFIACFETAHACGESGAHRHAIDLEISKQEILIPTNPMWAISVTLNITLDEYKRMRRKKTFGWRKGEKKGPEPMPRFKEIEQRKPKGNEERS